MYLDKMRAGHRFGRGGQKEGNSLSTNSGPRLARSQNEGVLRKEGNKGREKTRKEKITREGKKKKKKKSKATGRDLEREGEGEGGRVMLGQHPRRPVHTPPMHTLPSPSSS